MAGEDNKTATESNRFSGVPTTGLFEGQRNCIFFSPALLEQRIGNEIEIDSIGISISSEEVYTLPSIPNTRRFMWGPNSLSRTNNSLYRTLYKDPTVIGVMIQTIPPGPTTIFKIK